MNKYILYVLFLLVSTRVFAADEILSGYIQQGLADNLALKQKTFALQQSLEGLREARGLFLPSLSLAARYSRAGGGRLIEVPIGDLLNPIHQSLNQLLSQPQFPGTLNNVSIPFLRTKEHDTKLRLVQPLYQPATFANYRLNQYLIDIRKAEKDTYARELVADIKSSYYTYLQTLQLVALFDSTRIVLEENLRVSRSLVQADKATEDVVFNAQAELSDLQRQQAEAERNRTVARAYFNFLLNRSLDAPIETPVDKGDLPTQTIMDLDQAYSIALANRDEIKQLRIALNIAEQQIGVARAGYLPNVSLIADYGFQGTSYQFGQNDDYWLASVVFQWNIFNGYKDNARVQQQKVQQMALETQLQELERRIEFQVTQGYQNILVAENTLRATQERITSTRAAFNIVQRKYEEGMAPQIEFLDARNTRTSSEFQEIVATYTYHSTLAEFERILGNYELEIEN